MRCPWGVCFGPNGNIFVADGPNHVIHVFHRKYEYFLFSFFSLSLFFLFRSSFLLSFSLSFLAFVPFLFPCLSCFLFFLVLFCLSFFPVLSFSFFPLFPFLLPFLLSSLPFLLSCFLFFLSFLYLSICRARSLKKISRITQERNNNYHGVGHFVENQRLELSLFYNLLLMISILKINKNFL